MYLSEHDTWLRVQTPTGPEPMMPLVTFTMVAVIVLVGSSEAFGRGIRVHDTQGNEQIHRSFEALDVEFERTIRRAMNKYTVNSRPWTWSLSARYIGQ